MTTPLDLEAKADFTPHWRRALRTWTQDGWASVVHEALAKERSPGGNRPPGDWIGWRWQERHGPEYVAYTTNDGFELSIGFPDKWLVQIRHRDMLRLALWYVLRVWVVETWCGLKRWLWYRALHSIVEGHRRRRELLP